MDLFQMKKFTSHAGLPLGWKIECDALSNNEIDWAAYMISSMTDFHEVHGIPKGGMRIAKALRKYVRNEAGVILVVDDVITTGHSMVEYIKDLQSKNKGVPIRGISIFSRVPLPTDYSRYTENFWIKSIFNMGI